MFFTLAHDGFADPEFLDLLRARDESALQRLVSAYLPQILRAARGAGLNPQNAEDVCQSTFVTFIEKIEDFEGRSHIRTWLFGILYRKISEMRRSAARESGAESIDQVMETRFKTDGHWQKPPRGADSATYESEVREHLDDCMEGITTDQRMAFILREVEELDSEEICRTMDISRSNLGVLLYRGRNLLRECLENRNIRSY
ncbi:MAG: sigma-70 family RNA polymerase sigma factor [Candidatus Krumholzibacteria bacterium]|nr:sigma-70 family RNA polymerase sigma factor [Candidatus Krumholzibacteria bacterium]